MFLAIQKNNQCMPTLFSSFWHVFLILATTSIYFKNDRKYWESTLVEFLFASAGCLGSFAKFRIDFLLLSILLEHSVLFVHKYQNML